MLKVASGLAGVGSLNYQGTWNASSNVPFLQSGVGVKGYYYLVSVAGSTNLDGITNWQVNDWAVFDGTRWEKVDNNNSVISVNGQTGVVTLAAADVGATPNTAYVVAGTGLSGGGRLTGNVTVNLANTAVTAATYGNATSVSQITVDAQGRITNAANVTISIPGMGTVTNVATGTGLTGGPITTTGTISLANTAVTAGSYGNASTVAVLTVNAQGQLTAASNSAIAIGVAAVSGAVPNTVNVIAGTNLTGGGALTGNVTINNPYNGTVTNVATGTGLTGGPITSTGTVSLANTAVTAGSYGNASTVGSFTVDAQGRLTSASNSSIAISVSAVSGAVPNTVNVIAGTGLTGGGALTGNVTLSVTANSVNQKVGVQNNGVAVGSEPAINFIPGNNITLTTADDSINNRANVTIGVSGFGTIATQNANAVVITGGTIDNVTIGASTANTISYTTAVGTTSETVPLLIGGTTASSTLTLESTSGAGTTDSIIFKTGSQATAMTINTSGGVGIGTSSLTGYDLRVSSNITGATTSYSIAADGQIQSGVTTTATMYRSVSSTAAASFTLTDLNHYYATQGTFGSGSVVTNQYGFRALNTLTGATNNYGFKGELASATNVWNLYMNGSAPNYLVGNLGINSTNNLVSGGTTVYQINIGGNTTATTDQFGIFIQSVAQSNLTNSLRGVQTSLSTAATSFTLPSFQHFRAVQNTIGSGSTLTNQFGFYADSSMSGATNNYGFYGNLSSGTNNWNLYMNGSAPNYMAGALQVMGGTATPAGGSTTAYISLGSSKIGIYFGSGAPTVSAAQGSIYMRTDGSSTSTRMYINTNGSTTWTNVTTAA